MLFEFPATYERACLGLASQKLIQTSDHSKTVATAHSLLGSFVVLLRERQRTRGGG